MPISTELFQELEVTEKLTRELGLGLHVSIIRDITGKKEDKAGVYFGIILEQIDTEVCTAPLTDTEIRYKDKVKIHRGENRIGKHGYPIQAGDGWKRFFSDIGEQFPDLKEKPWGETLEELWKRPVKVWYTRSKEGYLNAHFTERAYKYALKNGNIGGKAAPDPDKKLNEDCPF